MSTGGKKYNKLRFNIVTMHSTFIKDSMAENDLMSIFLQQDGKSRFNKLNSAN